MWDSAPSSRKNVMVCECVFSHNNHTTTHKTTTHAVYIQHHTTLQHIAPHCNTAQHKSQQNHCTSIHRTATHHQTIHCTSTQVTTTNHTTTEHNAIQHTTTQHLQLWLVYQSHKQGPAIEGWKHQMLDPLIISKGVPQSAILGPTLFFYLHQWYSSQSWWHLSDSPLCRWHNSVLKWTHSAASSIQRSLTSTEQFFDILHLRLNTSNLNASCSAIKSMPD